MVPRRRNRDVFTGQGVSNFVDVDDEANDIELNNLNDYKITGGNVNANQNTCYQFTIPGDSNYKGRDINIDILQRYEDLKQILKRGNTCVSQDTNNEIKFAYVTASDATSVKNYGVDNGQTEEFACPDRIPNCLQSTVISMVQMKI
ncbi:unnamed protein product [Colias eurytheme]|nr:unnamed protein product [Colias eurytheme]